MTTGGICQFTHLGHGGLGPTYPWRAGLSLFEIFLFFKLENDWIHTISLLILEKAPRIWDKYSLLFKLASLAYASHLPWKDHHIRLYKLVLLQSDRVYIVGFSHRQQNMSCHIIINAHASWCIFSKFWWNPNWTRSCDSIIWFSIPRRCQINLNWSINYNWRSLKTGWTKKIAFLGGLIKINNKF